MTRAIVADLNGRHAFQTSLIHAVNYAIGALVAHDTARGEGGAFDGIDVERLFAAVQMLKDRNGVEIAPFVSAWSPTLDALKGEQHPRFPAFFERDLADALEKPNKSKLRRVFRQLFDAFDTSVDSGRIFAQLEFAMVDSLNRLAHVEAADVAYLTPLFDLAQGSGAAQVATLNYDLSVEIAAEEAGRTVDTGIESWEGGHDWSWSDASDVRLLKLHGSIDWRLREKRSNELLPEGQMFRAVNGQ